MAAGVLLTISSWLGVLALLAMGVFGLFRPAGFAAQVGVRAENALGLGELRALFGGFMLAMAAVLVCIGTPGMYLSIGLLWVGATVAKTLSIFLDNPPTKEGIQAVVADVVIAALVLSGYYRH